MSEQPPPPPPVTSPRTSFLERALPIIASERGLTPRANVLLSSLAKDMDLSADDYNAAMTILQSGERLAANATDPQRARFREFLKRQLQELKAGILSARHEQTLLAFAVGQLAMAEDSAREDLHLVAAELGLRKVPLEEALRFVEEIVAQKIGDDVIAERNDVLRLYHLGRDWSLEPADIDDLVRYRLEDNAARGRRDKLWNVGVIAGAVCAAALIVLLGIVLVVRNSTAKIDGTATTVPDVSSSESPAPKPRRTRLPTWWDTDLTIAVSQLRNEREAFAAVHDALIAAEPGRRSQGYELLLDQAGLRPFDVKTWKTYEPVLIGCYALEPDEGAATHLRARWLAVATHIVDTIPTSVDGYQAAIRPISSAARAIKDSRTPEARRVAMTTDLERLLRASLDTTKPEAEVLREYLAALSVVLLEQLADEVAKRPEVLSRHYTVLSALARDRATPEEQLRLDAAIAAAAVEHAPDSWRSWEAILQRGLEVRDPLALLRLVDAYERCENPELKKALGARLFTKVGVSAAGVSPSQYASVLRKALGASLPADTSDAGRWARLVPNATDSLSESQAANNDPTATLRATVSLAWHVNLAMSLGLVRPNLGQFDRWLADGPPWEKGEDEERPPVAVPVAMSERLTRDQQEVFDRYSHELGDWQKLDEGRRTSYLRGIAQLALRVNDISPIQGRQIAAYVLGRKSEEEQALVLDSASSLRWKQLRLAVADGIEKSSLAPDHLRRLVIVFTGHEVLDIDANRAAARRILLQSVIDELSSPRSGDAKSEAASDVDRWASHLAELYRQRAQLLGANPTELDTTASASGFLRIVAVRLNLRESESGDPTSRLILAADVIGQSDAQRSVALQRAAIERTLTDLSTRFPERRLAANKLVEQFKQRSATAKQVLPQLKEGEATLLQFWLLAGLK